ncbi:DMT family transporter [Acetobacter indonesiensis]|uniref:Membrane protein n=3 Tax=Acetobacter indonesiensis TaxID=104101 RepID=A0A6N3T6H8_9PROT|nr:DMT family transporter [Acetobacter indonesiensis]MCP1229793.1 DMT family transporter [Acetobacter indonesiensis]GEN03514.1 membrane protein [Acetobacter indonesiensis]
MLKPMNRIQPSTAPSVKFVSRQEMILIGITMLWGATFLIIHNTMRFTGPLFFVGLRFITAGVMSVILFRKSLGGLNRHELKAGCCIGVSVFLGYSLQTLGLKTISGTQSAFITALYVPMVPFLQWAVLRRRPHAMSWVGVACAFVGLLLLTGADAVSGVGFSAGEGATFLSAVAIAAEIILISRFALSVDSRRVTMVQLLVAGILALIAMPIAGESVPPFSWVWLVAAIGLGAMSAIIQFAMNWAQKTVSATRATVIYAAEPVWAGLVGRIAGERLPFSALIGAGMILVGVLASEIRLPRSRKNAKPVQETT